MASENVSYARLVNCGEIAWLKTNAPESGKQARTHALTKLTSENVSYARLINCGDIECCKDKRSRKRRAGAYSLYVTA